MISEENNLFLIKFAASLILSLKWKITGSCAGLGCVFEHACSQMSALGDTVSGCGSFLLFLATAIRSLHLGNLGRITELLLSGLVLAPAESDPCYRVNVTARSSLKAPCSRCSTWYSLSKWVVLAPSQPLRLGWSQGGGLGDADRAGMIPGGCRNPQGAAQVHRVLGWKHGGVHARLFRKGLLGVNERRRGFDGTLCVQH